MKSTHTCTALTAGMKLPQDMKGSRKTKDDLSCVHKHTKIPYVMRDPDDATCYDLLDISSIQHGLWVEEDSTRPGKYWVITFP